MNRVLMVALDAGDPDLIDRWTSDGTLPHLQALRRAGVSGRLRSSAEYLAGSPWPTFFTSQPPSRHGLYHDFQWRHEKMAFAAPASDWLGAPPFWRHLEGDHPVVAYDVPMNLGVEPFNGVEVSGWAAHDKLVPPATYPTPLLAEIERKFGAWHIGPESYGPTPVAELLTLREQLSAGVARSTDLALWLMQRPWALAIVAFGALHRGGHRLFDRSSIAGPVSESDGHRFDRGLRDLYVSCDDALGRLMAVTPDATVIAFSVHGMTANTSRVDLLDDMLARILAGGADGSVRRGALRRMGERLPLEWRRALTARVPRVLRDRLVTMWAAGGTRWPKTRAFSLRADLQGYVRVNMAGREPRGIVASGVPMDRLCEEIAEGLGSFRDARTGDPVIAAIERTSSLYPDGDRRDRLPDLIVRWSEAPANDHVALESPRFGRIDRATPGRIPNGRSGNHRGQGFLMARGPGIRAGSQLVDADILDLAPTVVRLLGTRATTPLAGRVRPELVPQA